MCQGIGNSKVVAWGYLTENRISANYRYIENTTVLQNVVISDLYKLFTQKNQGFGNRSACFPTTLMLRFAYH